jgi:hypothetical protein
MRLPVDPIPTVNTVIDPTEVTPTAAIKALRRVGEDERVPESMLHKQTEPAQVERQPDVERLGEDRRKMCRRIYHIPVLLDTRSGIERRKDSRRDGDPVAHMDREV